MKPVDTNYVIIPFDDSVKVGAYVFNGDVGSWGGVASPFCLSDGREGVGTPYFGTGISGLVSKLLGESPKPKLKISTEHSYILRSEIVDDKTIDEIKNLLTSRCAHRDCGVRTRYAVRSILWRAGEMSRNRTANVCLDHINKRIDDMAAYSVGWEILEQESSVKGSTEKRLGQIRL